MNSRLALVALATMLSIGCASSGRPMLKKYDKPLYGYLVFHGEVQEVEKIQYTNETRNFIEKYGKVVVRLDRVDLWKHTRYQSTLMWEGEQERTFRMVRSRYAECPEIGDRVMVTMLLHQEPSSFEELEKLALYIIYLSDREIEYKPIIDTWY